MALDTDTRKGFNGKEIPLDLPAETQLRLHSEWNDTIVAFVEWTGEVALPRESGAVARVAFQSGYTATYVAGELSLPR